MFGFYFTLYCGVQGPVQGFATNFYGRPQRAKVCSKTHVGRSNKHHCPMCFYAFQSWKRMGGRPDLAHAPLVDVEHPWLHGCHLQEHMQHFKVLFFAIWIKPGGGALTLEGSTNKCCLQNPFFKDIFSSCRDPPSQTLSSKNLFWPQRTQFQAKKNQFWRTCFWKPGWHIPSPTSPCNLNEVAVVRKTCSQNFFFFWDESQIYWQDDSWLLSVRFYFRINKTMTDINLFVWFWFRQLCLICIGHFIDWINLNSQSNLSNRKQTNIPEFVKRINVCSNPKLKGLTGGLSFDLIMYCFL